MGQAWDHFLSALPEQERLGIQPQVFHDAVFQTTLRTEDHVDLDGEVDAKNEPKKITIGRVRWKSNSSVGNLKISLHEYLGTLGLDRHYEISAPLTEKYAPAVLAQLSRERPILCTLTLFKKSHSTGCLDDVMNAQTEKIGTWSVPAPPNTPSPYYSGFAAFYALPLKTPFNRALSENIYPSVFLSHSRVLLTLTDGVQQLSNQNGSVTETVGSWDGKTLPNLSSTELELPDNGGFPEKLFLKTSANILGLNEDRFYNFTAELSCSR